MSKPHIEFIVADALARLRHHLQTKIRYIFCRWGEDCSFLGIEIGKKRWFRIIFRERKKVTFDAFFSCAVDYFDNF